MTFRTHAVELIKMFRETCFSRYPDDIDLISREGRDTAIGIETEERPVILFLMRGELSPAEAIAGLLKTPRLLKFSLRRTDDIWGRLHGEIDFDDLLAMTTIRYGAPEAFEFVQNRISQLRQLATEDEHNNTESPLKTIDAEWDEIAESVHWDSSLAKCILQFIFPAWKKMQSSSEEKRKQGIQEGHPTDYWLRYVDEEVIDGVKDQDVLRLILSWLKPEGEDEDQKGRLIQKLCTNKPFSEKFEHLATSGLSGQQLREIASKVFACGVRKDGAKACEYVIVGFIPLWRSALDRPLKEEEHLCWLEEEVKKAMEKSLRLCIDIFYYWRSNRRSDVNFKNRPDISGWGLGDYAKGLFRGNAQQFVSVLDPLQMYTSVYILAYFGEMSIEADEKSIRPDWEWFTELLLIAGKSFPQEVNPQLAALVVKEQHVFDGFTCSFHEGWAQTLFKKSFRELMETLALPVDASAFQPREKAIIEEAHRAAIAWLKTGENPKPPKSPPPAP